MSIFFLISKLIYFFKTNIQKFFLNKLNKIYIYSIQKYFLLNFQYNQKMASKNTSYNILNLVSNYLKIKQFLFMTLISLP